MKRLQVVLVTVVVAAVWAQGQEAKDPVVPRTGLFPGFTSGIPGHGTGAGHGGVIGGVVHPEIVPVHPDGLDCRPDSLTPHTQQCRYSQYDQYSNRYLCSRNQKPQYQCPRMRLECPNFLRNQLPQICNTDNDCPGVEKCCCDICLPHYVCKQPR
ncbi:uncharacterized protein LOC121866585 [Homarus americanus]|uniref:Putative crustin-like antimicrobial peptide 22 n=1 Tax=Homarus americanus TaxID=6706 RepID=A0A8J5K3Z6_HOMAM|nr:uncharacterized protein LOC121866585 [Homarus americanus]KAG7168976.1 putative crustin-like antimicrobial peptide 22 [Homarus americanus]